MSRPLVLLATCLALGVGCGPALVVRHHPGPPVVVRPADPGPGHVWVEGHYVWRDDRYAWVDGSWTALRPGHRWVDGHYDWVRRGGLKIRVWAPGHWVAGGGVVIRPAPAAEVRLIEPPSPPREVQPAAPAGEVHWVPGHHRWDAGREQYEWVPGHWTRPEPGRQWVPGHYKVEPHGRVRVRVWVPGHWAR